MKMEQRMNRKGNCWDNSTTERFFRSLKYEQLNYEKFRTKTTAKLSFIVLQWQTISFKIRLSILLQYERDFYKKAV
jgi:putative transposase